MIDFKIKAVLNPKGKKSSQGEAIYICINRKIRKYINLGLEKIPAKAWSGKESKWVNSHYPYAESHNRSIARAIHGLKEIIQEYSNRNETLTSELLKKIYEVKFLGKRIKGINGVMAPGASDTIVSYIDYYLTHGKKSKSPDTTRKVYVTLKKQIMRYRMHSSMAEINEEFVAGYVDFIRSEKVMADVTVEKYVDRLKVVYRDYCDQYGIPVKLRYFDNLDIDPSKTPEKIVYLNDQHYLKLKNIVFTPEESNLEYARDIFILLCNTSLYYGDLIKLRPQEVFDQHLLKENPDAVVLKGERKKNGRHFWIPLNNTAKEIFFKYYCPDCQKVFASTALSSHEFNKHLKTLAKMIGFSDVLTNVIGRKTCGTWTDRLGMGENDIKLIFGHKIKSILKNHYTEMYTIETYQRIISFIQR